MKEEILERFLRYAAVTTQSDPAATSVPSTEGQRKLAALLAGELKELGFRDVEISEHACVTAHLPSNLPAGRSAPTVGWVAHLDTVDAGLSPDIHPQVIRGYKGGDICQNKEKDLWIRTAQHPELERYRGDDLVVSDGTSVLGADNKSAIANVMTAMTHVVRENRPHGTIYVAFVPDEEIGLRGAKSLDLAKFPVDFAYTIDCCELGEVVWQTFNAGAATLEIKGVTAHPMSAKGVLVNPTQIACDFMNMMDRGATPECTEGTEGFVWVHSIVSNASHATVSIKIRDHSKPKYEEKKALIRAAADYLRTRYPRAKIDLTVKDIYGNIADALTPDNRASVDCLYKALEACGVKAKTIAMRGGTDGSFLSTKGIITPNYFTGALNFHSSAEFMPLSAVEKSTEVTLKLVELIAAQAA
ncbi:MAG: tripeptide aminopeptidase [Burkholderia sp.]|jgi:tripeptide aminopeptidase